MRIFETTPKFYFDPEDPDRTPGILFLCAHFGKYELNIEFFAANNIGPRGLIEGKKIKEPPEDKIIQKIELCIPGDHKKQRSHQTLNQVTLEHIRKPGQKYFKTIEPGVEKKKQDKSAPVQVSNKRLVYVPYYINNGRLIRKITKDYILKTDYYALLSVALDLVHLLNNTYFPFKSIKIKNKDKEQWESALMQICNELEYRAS